MARGRAARRRERSLERATYHHGDLRNALVATASTAVRAAGPAGLSVREVAREVGVSPNAAYRHFAGRAELLATVAEHARGAMGVAMAERLAAVPASGDPVALARARLAAVGRGYVEYAVAEPGLFRVVFDGPPPAQGMPGCVGGPDPWSMLQERLDELDAAGGLGAQGRAGADLAAWAAVHGLAELLVGVLAGLDAEEREQALVRTLATVGTGLAG